MVNKNKRKRKVNEYDDAGKLILGNHAKGRVKKEMIPFIGTIHRTLTCISVSEAEPSDPCNYQCYQQSQFPNCGTPNREPGYCNLDSR